MERGLYELMLGRSALASSISRLMTSDPAARVCCSGSSRRPGRLQRIRSGLIGGETGLSINAATFRVPSASLP